MEALGEIKQKIFRTECKEFLYEGMSRSEPVMTVDEHGIVDNYFIYAGNHEMTMVSPPMIAFGIYSDIGKTAYINTGIYDEGIFVRNTFGNMSGFTGNCANLFFKTVMTPKKMFWANM